VTVDPEFARWLREGALFAPADDAAVAAAWGTLARSSDILSAITLKAGAEAEAARQLAFLAGPLAVDEHLVAGSRLDLLGQAITIRSDRLGYQAGATVFVIGADEAEDSKQTTLTVLRKLP
jgi:hypothetical protein